MGWQEGEQLSAILEQCDVLILPSAREVWGLVVNEALAHGLYVVVSDRVGARDLVAPEIGRVVRDVSPTSLASSLMDVIDSGDFSLAARERRASWMEQCTVEGFADSVADAVNDLVRQRERSA
jgi:glycosyltransferase involved in cell wall biosynthesis